MPSDLDGLTPPPAGAPNVFVGYTATEYGNAQDAIRLPVLESSRMRAVTTFLWIRLVLWLAGSGSS